MKDQEVAKNGVCIVCGKPRARQTKYFCSPECRNAKNKDGELYIPRKSRTGEIHKRPKNGKIVNKKNGYISMRMPKHPNNQNGYVLEHRLVMEKKLGRYLEEWELVHHRNGVKDDNRIDNLEIVFRKTHFGEVRCPYCLNQFLIK